MILNNELQPERMTISAISEKFSAGEIFVDDDYQRRSVWVEKNKIRLLESVLTGYPMPEVYFWQDEPEPTTGKITLSIVDGQQRIRAITEYIAGEFKLNKSVLDRQNQSEDYVGKLFSDLKAEDRNKIWNYRLNVRVIPHTVTRDEIIHLFLRLNETDKSLNPQELRNAKFNGKFIQAAIEVADNDFWNKWSVFTPAIIRRMTDVTICSQFLAFFRVGLQGEITQKAINGLYDQFNDRYSQKNSDIEKCNNTLKFIDDIFSTNDDIVKFFKSQVHFYPLFIGSYIFLEKSNQINMKTLSTHLVNFAELYKKRNLSSSGTINEYWGASNEGTSRRSNREIRVNTILTVLENGI